MDRRTRFSLAQNYALYYGYGRTQELARYDVAVVEPNGHTSNSLQTLKAAGTLLIAYLSVMEVPPWSKDLSKLKAKDFLHLEGQPYVHQEFGNYWVDLKSPRWRRILLERVSYLLGDAGYDGVFLDTVGYVESGKLSPSIRIELQEAATKFVRQIRQRFTGSLIVQNCGLEQLLKQTAGYIDGVCWENPPFGQAASRDWVAFMVRSLEQLKRVYGLQILLLVEEDHAKTVNLRMIEQVATDKQFLLYSAPSAYTAGVTKM